MGEQSTEQLYEQALALTESGRLEEARVICERICRQSNDNADAWLMLGTIYEKLGNLEAAARCLRQAVKLDVRLPRAHFDLARILQTIGDFDEAIEHAQIAVTIDPDLAAAWILLAEVHGRLGKLDAAQSCASRAIKLEPNSAHAHLTLGKVLMQMNRCEEAADACGLACDINPLMSDAWHVRGLAHLRCGNVPAAEHDFRRLIAMVPDHADAHLKLGAALHRQGLLKEARECNQRALDLAPDNAEVVFSCASLDRSEGRLADAVQGYRRAIDLKPDFAEAFNNLGNILQIQKHFVEAANCFTRAIAIKPNIAVVHYNLANALTYQNRMNEAITSYRRSLELDPNNAAVHSNLLLNLNYDPNQRPDVLYMEHLRWGEIHGPPFALPSGYPNAADPDRTLRIGYVSSDFRIHPVGHLIAPVLKYHNRERVETFCYSDVTRPDQMTQTLRHYCAVWRDTGGMSNDAMASLIREDSIDILVDLTGHTANSRLKVFAMKPAPIQVTYMGYPNTTGLRAVDYALTDEVADPPTEDSRRAYCEELVYLNTGFTCYEPPADAPDVGPLPLRRNGHLTFGSLNNLVKLNDQVIALWGAVLNRMPSARLLICRDLLTSEFKEDLCMRFLQHGISRDRLDLVSDVTVGRGHLGVYNRIDVALDPFPWTGHFTTCEALWMGVPVITLLGNRHAGRMVASVLHQVGLKRMIARSSQEYVEIASALFEDPRHLELLRANLRENVRKSVLCDGARFVETLEGAFRDVWRRWCET
jgi:predicted O-linked N-acetylglucosamine transferase (SPINDLY family)